MTFEEWWNTLTIKEQTLIGKNNAKFVWVQAINVCLEISEDFLKEKPEFKNYENTYMDGWLDACNEIGWSMEKMK